MVRYFHTALIFILTLFFSACSQPTTISDLTTLPQDAKAYTYAPTNEQTKAFLEHSKTFKTKFYAPWNQEAISITLEKATWGNQYINQKVYGMNHQLLTPSWFETLNQNSDWDNFNTLKQSAITIKNANLRVFPTNLPIFYNPKKAGEGFPFDYNQNSGIKINTPLLISHFSKDKKWVFVESGFAFGWMQTSKIAIVNKKIKETFYNSELYVATKDDVPIFKNGFFIETMKLGTIVPKSVLGNFFVINHYHNLEGYIQTIQTPQEALHTLPLPFTQENIENGVNELINEPYGWGEAFNKRDCSALTKDFFTLFGLYLNRNSKQQIKNGEYISLKEFSAKEKKEKLKALGQPFSTLIYLPGHIMIYAGVKENEPLAFHNFWGIKTENFLEGKGRFVVGHSAITTLEPGKELSNYNATSNILEKIEGIVLLAP